MLPAVTLADYCAYSSRPEDWIMKRKNSRIHVDIDIAGRSVAAADVEQYDELGVSAPLFTSSRPPPGSRARLVDTILDLPEVHTQQRLEAALLIGETEILQRLRERFVRVQTRPAGATCLVDADLPRLRPGHQLRHRRRPEP
jgi:hypothetical protein